LRSNWRKRINILDKINWDDINEFNKTFNKLDVYKVYAFQLGQSLGLHDGIELYTKNEISKQYPQLREYLYRENASFNDLLNYLNRFIEIIKSYKVIEKNLTTTFCDFNKTINLKTEKYIEV